MRTSFVAFPLLVVALVLTTQRARACSDAGPINGHCNDGGAAFISCAVHADCPEGQLCGADALCNCATACEETCTSAGCHCCNRIDAGCLMRFACDGPEPVDGGRGSMDGGVTEPEPAGSCAIARVCTGSRGLLLVAALAVCVAAARHRRR